MENIYYHGGSVNERDEMDCKDNGKSAVDLKAKTEGPLRAAFVFGIWIT